VIVFEFRHIPSLACVPTLSPSVDACWWVEPFSYNTRVWQTDRRTDTQTRLHRIHSAPSMAQLVRVASMNPGPWPPEAFKPQGPSDGCLRLSPKIINRAQLTGYKSVQTVWVALTTYAENVRIFTYLLTYQIWNKHLLTYLTLTAYPHVDLHRAGRLGLYCYAIRRALHMRVIYVVR